MEYYNEQDSPNHKVIKIKYLNKNKSYKNTSTDNIFRYCNLKSLHNMYNKFLVNPYLIRNSRYKNALNNADTTRINNRYQNMRNFIIPKEEIINEEKKESFNIEPLNRNKSTNDLINLPNINNNKEDNIVNNNKNIRNELFNEAKLQRYKEEYKINNLNNNMNKNKKNDHLEFPAIKKSNYNTIERPIEYNINHENDRNDLYYTNNKNKLSLSYDFNSQKSFNNVSGNKYISPIVTKLAKHNYLMRNPYSYKNDCYLGPTSLINNPILYPISTYKFDLNRYIRNYYVNKNV